MKAKIKHVNVVWPGMETPRTTTTVASSQLPIS